MKKHTCINCGKQWENKPGDSGKPTVYCPFCKQENINFVSYQHQKD